MKQCMKCGTFISQMLFFCCRCDGKYVLSVYPAGQTPGQLRVDRSRDHVRFGYIKGMGCDEVSYATQSASNAVIQLGGCRVQCDILRENMSRAEERLYIGLNREAVSILLSHFKQQKKKPFESSEAVPVHFQLKYFYFRSLKESIRNMQKHVISRILPYSSSFLAVKPADGAVLAPYKKYCSPDQYEALKVIASTPASGPPVLIAGPFGTGKTHVLAIAAHHFLLESMSKRSHLAILVCTQQNISADAYLAMYDNFTKEKEEIAIIRLIPKYSLQKTKYTKTVDSFKREWEHKSSQNLKRYLIVTTCLTARQIADVLPPRFFTHIFLDEGAQMREPEAVAPLCMATQNTKLVIAGDKFQV